MRVPVEDFFEQVEAAVGNRLYYLALAGALVIPDMCGAMEARDGRATRDRYVAWFDTYVASNYEIDGRPTFTGEDCYRFRCSLLHQGRTVHPQSPYKRILFFEPGALVAGHNNVLFDALNLDVARFTTDVVKGARLWHRKAKHSRAYCTNWPDFMQRHPNGLPPYVVGFPIIG